MTTGKVDGVESALAELREMFPLHRIAIKVAVGPTKTNVPYYWVHVIGKYEPSVGIETLSEAMAQARVCKESQQ